MSTQVEAVGLSFNRQKFPKAALLLNAALSGRYRVIIMGGAVRGGKSFGIGGTLFTLQHDEYPHSRSIVVRDTLQTLRNTTLPTIEKLMPAFRPKSFKGDPQFLWKFQNNSSFQFFAEQDSTDPEHKRWDGLEVNYIWLEQVEGLTRKTFDKALERVGSYFIPKHLGTQPPPIIFVSLNPTDDWPREVFYDPYINGTLPDDWLYIPANIFDNAGLEQSYIESLQTLKITNPIRYKRYVEGNWDVREKTGGEWYGSFDYGKHTGKAPFKPELLTDVHSSFDFNVVPYMSNGNFQVDMVNSRLQIRFFKEYCLSAPDNRTDRVCQHLIRDYLGPYRKSVTYHGDRQGENRIEGMGNVRRFDDVRATLKPYLHARSNQVNKAVVVNSMSRDFVNDLLAGHFPVDILIDEDNCPNLIKDLATTKEGANGIHKEMGKDANGNRYEKNGHCLSWFTYGVLSIPEVYSLFQQWKRQRGTMAE
jgi:hypothetical protein